MKSYEKNIIIYDIKINTATMFSSSVYIPFQKYYLHVTTSYTQIRCVESIYLALHILFCMSDYIGVI